MAKQSGLQGVIRADVIEVRFSFSGLVTRVNKRIGDSVAPKDVLAGLDRRELQAVLDKELADYERARADFEIFNLAHPDPGLDKIKYEKIQTQAVLNSSVKAVEIAKLRLDQADLTSPVSGIVIDDSLMRPGLFITPGSHPFQILDTDSFQFVAAISPDDYPDFPTGSKIPVKIGNRPDPLEGVVLPYLPVVSKSGLVDLRLSLPAHPSLLQNLPADLVL